MCMLLVSNYTGGFHFVSDQISPFTFINVAPVSMHKWNRKGRKPPVGKGHCVSKRCNIFWGIEFVRGQPHSLFCRPGLLLKCAWHLPWRVRGRYLSLLPYWLFIPCTYLTRARVDIIDQLIDHYAALSSYAIATFLDRVILGEFGFRF